MIVTLEFFRESPGECRVSISIEKINIKGADVAVKYARGAIDNTVFNGKMADGCLIKSEKGVLICVVKRNAHRP
ncbi:hypothetical protein [Methylocystis rosea]|uniref:hypothetical protein n=1 Tax=Methylocystis rosea TaxID=173366 RepID=UPI0012EBCDE4|nr:hypothetical protein [Methylocystis rosea]